MTAIAVIVILLSKITLSTQWNYKHEDEWPIECKIGKEQSPVDLSTNVIPAKFPPLLFEHFGKPSSVRSQNNGHTNVIRLQVHDQPTIKGGCLPHNIYVLDHLHFHWNSEHTIMGKRFPLELHLVHYARKYQNLSNALKHYNGAAVISALYDYSTEDNEIFKPLIIMTDKIERVNETEEMTLYLSNYFPKDTTQFYCYNGSLTTPGCTEGITWLIFSQTIPISKSQVAHFANLETEEHEKLIRNYRSLQRLNNRKIFFSGN